MIKRIQQVFNSLKHNLPEKRSPLIIFGLFLIVLALPVAVILVQRQIFFPQAASSGVNIFLAQNGLRVNDILSLPINEQFEVDLMMNTPCKQISGVNIVIEFDDYLVAQDIVVNEGNFDTTIIPGEANGIDNNPPSGKRSVQLVAVSKGSSTKGGKGLKLGTILFKPVKATPSDPANLPILNFSAKETQIVAVNPYNEALDIDKSHTVKYKVVGAAAATPTQAPAPGQSEITSPSIEEVISASSSVTFEWDLGEETAGETQRLGLRVVKLSAISSNDVSLACSDNVVIDRWWYKGTWSSVSPTPALCSGVSNKIPVSSINNQWTAPTLGPGVYYAALFKYANGSYSCSLGCEGQGNNLASYTSGYYFSIGSGPTVTPTLNPSLTPTNTPSCNGENVRGDFDGDCCVSKKYDAKYIISNWTNQGNPYNKQFDPKTDLDQDRDVDADDYQIFVKLYKLRPCVE